MVRDSTMPAAAAPCSTRPARNHSIEGASVQAIEPAK